MELHKFIDIIPDFNIYSYIFFWLKEMKKIIGLILLFALTGCSYNTDFYIFNTTEKPIFVTYECRPNGKVFVPNPRIVEFDSDFEIREIKKAYEIDTESKTESDNKIISCVLKSGQALWIGNDLNFSLNNPNDALILKENLNELNVEQNGVKLFRVDDKYIVDFFETIDRHTVGIKVKKASR